MEDFINNEQVNLDDEQPHISVAFNAIKKELESKVTDIYAQECALYSDFLKVAGRVDCVGVYNGILSIIDFKTSRRHKTKKDVHSYFMQEAAYAIMFEERTTFFVFILLFFYVWSAPKNIYYLTLSLLL